MKIVNRIVIDGKAYIQLDGRDRSMWWEESSSQFTDGTALDTDELSTIRDERAELEREYRKAKADNEERASLEDFEQELAQQAAQIRLLESLQRGYGAKSWFG